MPGIGIFEFTKHTLEEYVANQILGLIHLQREI